MATYSRSDYYAEALLRSLDDTGDKDIDTYLDRFVSLLEEDNAISLAPSIISSLEKQSLERDSAEKIKLTFAREQSRSTVKAFEKFGEIVEVTDENLLGGFRMQSIDSLIDGSALGQLEYMRRALQS